VVSTHAPLGLGERRAAQALAVHWLSCFNPRSPRPRGATRSTPSWRLSRSFQPTLPSASGSDHHLAVETAQTSFEVSTHAPLGLGERRPGALGTGHRDNCFNPRSPRPRGATTGPSSRNSRPSCFNPRSPRPRGATHE